MWLGVRPQREPAFACGIEAVTLPKRSAHPDFMKTGGQEYGLNEENLAVGGRLTPTLRLVTRVLGLPLIVIALPAETS